MCDGIKTGAQPGSIYIASDGAKADARARVCVHEVVDPGMGTCCQSRLLGIQNGVLLTKQVGMSSGKSGGACRKHGWHCLVLSSARSFTLTLVKDLTGAGLLPLELLLRMPEA